MDQPRPVERFLKLPELIERLVSFLDAQSTLCLLRSRVMDKETREKSFSSKAWSQLIRRTLCGQDGLLLIRRTPEMVEAEAEVWCGVESWLEVDEGVKDLVKILKLLQLEQPNTFMLPLLDLICESIPSMEHIAIRCPCHTEPHIVSWRAFLLLEEVEGAFGTAEQSIQSMSNVWSSGGLLRAISCRMSRQKETVTSLNGVSIQIRNAGDAQYVATIMQAQEVSLCSFGIRKLREEAWEELAAVFRGNPNVVIRETHIAKEELTEERRDTIMRIWDASTWFKVTIPTFFEGLFVDKSK